MLNAYTVVGAGRGGSIPVMPALYGIEGQSGENSTRINAFPYRLGAIQDLSKKHCDPVGAPGAPGALAAPATRAGSHAFPQASPLVDMQLAYMPPN